MADNNPLSRQQRPERTASYCERHAVAYSSTCSRSFAMFACPCVLSYKIFIYISRIVPTKCIQQTPPLHHDFNPAIPDLRKAKVQMLNREFKAASLLSPVKVHAIQSIITGK